MEEPHKFSERNMILHRKTYNNVKMAEIINIPLTTHFNGLKTCYYGVCIFMHAVKMAKLITH